MSATPAIVCSVGTTDPWNAAGIGLDVRVLAALGIRPATVVAGVSAQGPQGIADLQAIRAETISAQFASLRGTTIAAYRVGALLDVASVDAVARALATCGVPVVYDPVLAASNGGRFADDATRRAIVERLLPCVTLVTPNLAEARALSGIADAAPAEAARALRERGARAVLVTGVESGDEIEDLLVDAGGTRSYAASRIATELRGTGCILACAIAAHLARADRLEEAIASARAFVRARILDGETIGTMRMIAVSASEVAARDR